MSQAISDHPKYMQLNRLAAAPMDIPAHQLPPAHIRKLRDDEGTIKAIGGELERCAARIAPLVRQLNYSDRMLATSLGDDLIAMAQDTIQHDQEVARRRSLEDA
ncbi:hypothetical protein [Acetobacter malorum]|uniref:hypothetical protein n=1 Tax=Acetobacter malorum TaxID=178901 RepID=UPI0039EA97E5